MKLFSTKRYIALALLGLFMLGVANAQNTRANAKKLFEEKRYAEALPVLERLLKKSPRSGEYNYWYAVCCYMTGDTAVNIEEKLKYAASRKVTDAYDQLGDIYKNNCRYKEAIDCYDSFLEESDDDDKIAATEEKWTHTKELLRMLKNTEKVCIVDSFIVDKTKFLSAYRCGRDVGVISMASAYFGKQDAPGTIAETERGTDLYFSQRVAKDSLSFLKIFHSSKNGDKWSDASQLKGYETNGNDITPFMSADGTTFYFASDGEGSIGGYDIFVTRYDSESGAFMRPSNLGMPFNSEANDYMMVINEIANLGWFATDRRMPDNKVCVYVFVPNAIREVYDFEAEDYNRILRLSQLQAIAETQTDQNTLRKARQQLMMLLYEQQGNQQEGDFLFVIDDMTNYTRLSDFHNSKAREMFIKWQKRKTQYSKDIITLDKKREQYAEAASSYKVRLRSDLSALEKRLEMEDEALQRLEKDIRNTEINYLNNR